MRQRQASCNRFWKGTPGYSRTLHSPANDEETKKKRDHSIYSLKIFQHTGAHVDLLALERIFWCFVNGEEEQEIITAHTYKHDRIAAIRWDILLSVCVFTRWTRTRDWSSCAKRSRGFAVSTSAAQWRMLEAAENLSRICMCLYATRERVQYILSWCNPMRFVSFGQGTGECTLKTEG